MDAETQAAIERLATRLEAVHRDVAGRVRWLSEHHEREWKDAAAWRTQWTTELDALILEVELLKSAVRALEQNMGDTNESQSERIYRKVNELTRAFADVLFEMLPDERQPLKDRFTASLGDLLAEVIGGSTTMAAGVVVALNQRMDKLEEKQVGDDASG
jgi:hypothetical protein